MMANKVVTLELPLKLYNKLQKRAAAEQTDPVDLIARLVEDSPLSAPAPSADPVFELIGAYRSEQPLIDNISVSEDPDLYLIAEMMDQQASDLHAWELAPTRYKQGPDGKPMRHDTTERET